MEGVGLASEEEISRLWRIRRTVSKMLEDRGYMIEEDEYKRSLEDFREHFDCKPGQAITSAALRYDSPVFGSVLL